MPLIDPRALVLLRRHKRLTGAVAVFLLFTVVNLAWVRPLASRYRALTARATALGMAVDPEAAPRTVSPALLALFAANALPPQAAQQQATSGQLTATLLEDMARLASKSGLQVLVAEQGAATQQAGAVQVRGHLRLQGGYGGLVTMIGEIVRSGRLYAIDRFLIASQGTGPPLIELWVTREVLKVEPSGVRG